MCHPVTVAELKIFSEVSYFHSQLVVQLSGKVMQNITFFRMQGLQKCWHFWQCGDSKFSQHVDLLVAPCTDFHYFKRGRQEGNQQGSHEPLRVWSN